MPLSDLLQPVSRPEPVRPDGTYQILGARWYGKGLYTKDVKSGNEIQAKKVYKVSSGDFVYNRLFAWKGSFAIASQENDGCYVSNEFLCYLVNPRLLDTRFLMYYFSRQSAWSEALGLSTGSTPTSRNRLKEGQFLGMRVPVPSRAEQERVVVGLDAISGKIRKAQELRQMATEEAGTLLSSERAHVFEAAAENGTVRLQDLVTLERGRFSYRPRNDPRFFGGAHPWIQIREIETSGKYISEWSETLNDEGLGVSKKFPRGTVVVSIAATIGAVGILEFDCCFPDSIVGVTPNAGTESEYVYHYLCHVRSHLEDVAPQSAQKNINLEILSALAIPALPTDKQRKVVAHLNAVETAISSLREIQVARDAELNAMLPAVLDRAMNRAGVRIGRIDD